MKKLPLISVFILGLCIAPFAQTNTNPSCPAISVTGPAGIVMPNEVAQYTATVDTKGQNLDLTYFWSVSAGKIISGQGTLGIEVRWPERETLTVTIEVKGVPEGCTFRASETASICLPPQPVKLAQFDGSKFVGDKIELNKIVREMNDNPNDQLYVYFAYKQESLGKAVEIREQRAVDYLSTAVGDRTRITVVQLFEAADLVQFWLVPPGANNPLCDGCDESACPTISVNGPASITEIGDTMKFAANPPLQDFENLNYKWTVSSGTIIEGQGKPWITVQTTREMSGETVTAKVEIVGLPEQCSKTAKETALVIHGFDPVPSDEFGKLRPNDEKGRIDVFLTLLLNNKDDKGYIVLDVAKGTTDVKLKRRIKRIKDHIFVFRKFKKERILLLTRDSDNENTVLWRVPPGAEDEFICSDCWKK